MSGQEKETPILKPFQSAGVTWLADRRTALLADEMGLGKSAQVIVAADRLSDKEGLSTPSSPHRTRQRVLVLCPAVARINWSREFEKFSALSREWTVIFDGRMTVPPGHSAICSYDLAAKNKSLWAVSWDLLVLDEAHFVKNPRASRSKAVWGKTGLVRQAKRVWALSGTPIPNHPGELWCLLYTFGATKLPYDDFLKTYCNGYLMNFQFRVSGTKQSKISEFKRLLAPHMLRRKKEDVLKELPPITFEEVAVEASPVDINVESSLIQYAFPMDRRGELEKKLEEERQLVQSAFSHADVTHALMGLAKSVSTLRRYVGLQKRDSVAKLVAQELEDGQYQKIVIFGIHRDVIEGLRSSLKAFDAVTLYGGTDPKTRQKNIDRFQNNPKCRVFIGNIKACGTAITLTAADQVLFVEEEWTPADNAQAAMRVHRIGQSKPVSVRITRLPDSLDQKIGGVLARKTREIAELLAEKEEFGSPRNQSHGD